MKALRMTGFRVAACAVLLLAGLALWACSTAELGAIAVIGGPTSGAGASGTSSTASGSVSGAPSSGSGGSSGATGSGSTDTGAAPPGSKRGYAYGNNSVDDLTLMQMHGVSWWQNWTDAPDNCLGDASAYLPTMMEYVPMVWGAPWVSTTALDSHVPAGARYLLTFQLPNYTTGPPGQPQSNLPPAIAASKWPTIQAFAASRHLQIVSPAPDYCAANAVCNQADPHAWLDAFMAACKGCQIDFVGVSAITTCDTASLQANLNFYKKYGKPLFITQLTCGTSTDPAVIQLFMQDAVPMLEGDPMVFRYAWFIGRSGKTCGAPPDAGSGPLDLLGPPGSLTPLGMTYVGL
jgi:hypothetical protein